MQNSVTETGRVVRHRLEGVARKNQDNDYALMCVGDAVEAHAVMYAVASVVEHTLVDFRPRRGHRVGCRVHPTKSRYIPVYPIISRYSPVRSHLDDLQRLHEWKDVRSVSPELIAAIAEELEGRWYRAFA